MRLDGHRARQSLIGLSAHCANSYIPHVQHITASEEELQFMSNFHLIPSPFLLLTNHLLNPCGFQFLVQHFPQP